MDRNTFQRLKGMRAQIVWYRSVKLNTRTAHRQSLPPERTQQPQFLCYNLPYICLKKLVFEAKTFVSEFGSSTCVTCLPTSNSSIVNVQSTPFADMFLQFPCLRALTSVFVSFFVTCHRQSSKFSDCKSKSNEKCRQQSLQLKKKINQKMWFG